MSFPKPEPNIWNIKKKRMGWLFSSRWQSKEDVLNHYKNMYVDSGYDVKMKGNCLLAEKR
jgi:hypothetical protein